MNKSLGKSNFTVLAIAFIAGMFWKITVPACIIFTCVVFTIETLSKLGGNNKKEK